MGTKKFVRLLIFIFMVMPVLLLQAQSQKAGSRGYFMIGSHFLQISKLNDMLKKQGYSKFSSGFISLGGGGYRTVGLLIIGGEGHGLLNVNGSSVNNKFKSSLSAGYGFFDLGYLIYSNPSLDIYPMLGIGGGAISLKIRPTSPINFDEALVNPQKGVNLSTGGFLLNFAFGTEYFLKTENGKDYERGLIIGLRLGYVVTPIKGNWKFQGLDVADGPKIGFTGPYLRLEFGGGRAKEHLKTR